MMSLLIDTAPESVIIDNTEVKINSDFRTSILFEQMMFDNDFPEYMKTSNALNLFYPILPENTDEAVKKMIWFYSGGKNTEKQSGYGNSSSKCYDFEYDDDYIFAAFMQQYGIDLESIEYLHWWKFRAMFRSLSDNCEFVKIMGYRSIKIDSKMSSKERQFYTKMKKLYALPKSRNEIQKINEIEEMLMNISEL